MTNLEAFRLSWAGDQGQTRIRLVLGYNFMFSSAPRSVNTWFKSASLPASDRRNGRPHSTSSARPFGAKSPQPCQNGHNMKTAPIFRHSSMAAIVVASDYYLSKFLFAMADMGGTHTYPLAFLVTECDWNASTASDLRPRCVGRLCRRALLLADRHAESRRILRSAVTMVFASVRVWHSEQHRLLDVANLWEPFARRSLVARPLASTFVGVIWFGYRFVLHHRLFCQPRFVEPANVCFMGGESSALLGGWPMAPLWVSLLDWAGLDDQTFRSLLVHCALPHHRGALNPSHHMILLTL